MPLLLRKEIQTFASTCENFLSFDVQSELTSDERALVRYYLKELEGKFCKAEAETVPSRG